MLIANGNYTEILDVSDMFHGRNNVRLVVNGNLITGLEMFERKTTCWAICGGLAQRVAQPFHDEHLLKYMGNQCSSSFKG